MKKVLVLCMAIVMVLSVGITAFAAPGGFVSSPSANSAPVITDFEVEAEDCEAKLTITPYSERHTLPDDIREKMEKAYNDILANTDVTKLSDALTTLAKDKNVDVKNLAISDLFDITYYNCGDHQDHGYFDITFKADTLKNFVGLLHLKNGKWELVKGAKVVNGTHLTFKVDSLSPFAIVVDTVGTPTTGQAIPWVYIALMVVSAVGIVAILFYLKKKKA